MSELLQFHIDMEPESRWNIPTVDPATRASFLYVQETGDFRSKKGYYTTREGLDSYLLKLTLSGQGILEYGGETHTVQSGDFFWIQCSRRQHYYTDPNIGKWHTIWVHFRGANAEAYYQAFLQAHQNPPIGHLPARTEATKIIRQLLDFYEKGGSDLYTDLQASALLTTLLAGCIHAASNQDSSSTIPRVLQELREYLDTAYGEHISLDSLAARFSVSKYHLQRSFKRCFGQTPADYLTAVRMANAKRLLRTTDRSINDVAAAVGFETASHFISAFRKREEITPQKYRKSWSNDQ